MATKVTMPKLSDTMTEGLILKWLKKEGEQVKQGEIIVEIESDKADMELEAYESGILRKIVVGEKEKAPIGGVIAIIGNATEDISAILSDESGKPIPQQAGEKSSEATDMVVKTPPPKPMEELAFTAPPGMAKPAGGFLKASPLARKIAGDLGIDLRDIQGSGPAGRVIKRDLAGYKAATTVSTPPPRQQVFLADGTTKDVELSPIRKTIAKRMTESKQTAPHFYVTFEVSMDAIAKFRDEMNAGRDVKISYTDILIRACALTLLRHPQVNGRFLGDTMREHHFAHIGVAVALEEGLVTPVLQNAHAKGIGRINEELRDLVERARNRKLKPEEYSGSTFTISNLGMYGAEDFIAIVNPPEGAILAVGAIVKKPVVQGDQIVIGQTMKITLSSDHRIIDGAIAASFLRDLKAMLENPATMAL